MDRKSMIIFCVGILSGVALTKLLSREKSVGNLRIDRSDPNEEPYLFLELDRNVKEISKKKTVMLNVLDKNYLTAK